MCQTMDARRFPNTWHPLSIVKSRLQRQLHLKKWAYRDDEMRHITILCDDLQPRNGVAVSDDIVEYAWAILLDPFTNKFLCFL